jgi:hypothetical protein
LSFGGPNAAPLAGRASPGTVAPGRGYAHDGLLARTELEAQPHGATVQQANGTVMDETAVLTLTRHDWGVNLTTEQSVNLVNVPGRGSNGGEPSSMSQERARWLRNEVRTGSRSPKWRQPVNFRHKSRRQRDS